MTFSKFATALVITACMVGPAMAADAGSTAKVKAPAAKSKVCAKHCVKTQKSAQISKHK
jgi:hypothetical protein